MNVFLLLLWVKTKEGLKCFKPFLGGSFGGSELTKSSFFLSFQTLLAESCLLNHSVNKAATLALGLFTAKETELFVLFNSCISFGSNRALVISEIFIYFVVVFMLAEVKTKKRQTNAFFSYIWISQKIPSTRQMLKECFSVEMVQFL